MRRIIGCTELAAGSNDKIRGGAISSGLLRKKGSLSSPVPHWVPSHILHFQPSITTNSNILPTHTNTPTYKHKHAQTHKVLCVKWYSLKVFLCYCFARYWLGTPLRGFKALKSK